MKLKINVDDAYMRASGPYSFNFLDSIKLFCDFGFNMAALLFFEMGTVKRHPYLTNGRRKLNKKLVKF